MTLRTRVQENPEPWRSKASCRGADTELFYPPRDRNKYQPTAKRARRYCVGDEARPACPVRTECLRSAIARDEKHGIWGGLSHRERNALVRRHG